MNISKLKMKYRVFKMILIIYYNVLKEASCYNSISLRERPSYNKNYVNLEKSKNSVKSLKANSMKTGRGSKLGHRIKKMETLEELFSTDNDEKKLIKEKAAYERYTSELRNPLIRKIAHDNQIKSRVKIKKLAKRAEKKSRKYLKKILNTVNSKGLKPIESNTSMTKGRKGSEKNEGLVGEYLDKEGKYSVNLSEEERNTSVVDDKNEQVKVYKRRKITERELRELPLRVPGIRALDYKLGDDSVEEIDSLIKLGYDGIVDMNSLFAETSEKSQMYKKGNDYEANIKTKEGEMEEKNGIDENMKRSCRESFDSLGIYDSKLVKTLKIKGISRPTVTQSKFIPELTKMLQKSTKTSKGELKSSIIHASTGSGKTLTYMLPIMQSCYNASIPMFTHPSAFVEGDDSGYESTLFYTRELLNQDVLVVCPSLELCVQSCNVAKQISELYESMESGETENNFYSEFSKILGIEATNRNKYIRVKTEIKPTLLIGNANILYQKKNIKKINGIKLEDYKEAKEVIDRNRETYMLSRGLMEPEGEVKRTVGMYFATPGRLYSVLYRHKLLDIGNFKYIVMDEYDGYLEFKKSNTDAYMSGSDESETNIKNKETRELIQNMFSKLKNENYRNGDSEESLEEHKVDFCNLRRKYVVCVSASDNIEMMPEELREQFEGNKREKRKSKIELSVESRERRGENTKKATKFETSYEFPKNILHTMAIYSVPDAKLSLLRKILKSVPYNKSVLIFCDSNGTASFLYKYLSGIFHDASIELLNSVQNRLSRKKAFSNLIKTNIDNTNLYNINKKTTRLVKDILISTRLNSRGIDFSGYTHVINYDLPHDADSYVHKSGRIGRAGNPGICISLVESKNFPAFKRVIVDHLPLDFHKIDSNNGLLVTKK